MLKPAEFKHNHEQNLKKNFNKTSTFLHPILHIFNCSCYFPNGSKTISKGSKPTIDQLNSTKTVRNSQKRSKTIKNNQKHSKQSKILENDQKQSKRSKTLKNDQKHSKTIKNYFFDQKISKISISNGSDLEPFEIILECF